MSDIHFAEVSMYVKVTKAYTLRIPKRILQEYRLLRGDLLNFYVEDDILHIYLKNPDACDIIKEVNTLSEEWYKTLQISD